MQTNGLIRYMEKLQNDLEVRLVIKDFVGFLDLDNQGFKDFRKFLVHDAPYCMFIKEQSHLWHQCLSGKELLQDKLGREMAPYYGCCYAGVGEYVVPIIVEERQGSTLIGALMIGGFHHQGWVEKRLSLENIYRIDGHAADVKYLASFKENNIDLEEVLDRSQVIADHMAMLYSHYKLSPKADKQTKSIGHNYIIGHAMAYINRHYVEAITLQQVAEFCHCSNSYISHNFRKLTGKSIKSYINQKRVEASKVMMRDGSLTIAQVAYDVGYRDSNYFSKVFKEIEGVSPIVFRDGLNKDVG